MQSEAGNRILARAVVEIEAPALNGRLGQFRVEVWGKEEPYDFVRVYTIQAKSDDVAAREGLDRFVAEMQKKIDDGEI